MIQTKQQSRQMIWFDSTLLPDVSSEMFHADYWQQRDAVIGSAQGRGTTWFVQTPLLPAALRHYRRGGLFGKLVSDHYWFSGWNHTRCAQEFQLLHHLIDCGVHVPRPIAARAIKRNFCYQADLLSEKIADAQDLVSILQVKPLIAELYYAIGQQIAKMHQAQVNHTDLNIHNILLDSTNKVWLIDFDKCDQQRGEHWQKSNLARLKRSFVKEQNKRNIHWNDTEFEHLMQGYHHG